MTSASFLSNIAVPSVMPPPKGRRVPGLHHPGAEARRERIDLPAALIGTYGGARIHLPRERSGTSSRSLL
jgi:hypothetical protein